MLSIIHIEGSINRKPKKSKTTRLVLKISNPLRKGNLELLTKWLMKISNL
jgi:hypothetical protein